jgi:predicted NBD/HSP70 family sugar kinase
VRALASERQSLATIINLVRDGRASTRLDLEREAHLGRSVVADRLTTLAGFGLIDEEGVGRSVGGRAPRLVRFRSEAGRLLVANVDRDTIGVGLADLKGQLILEHYEDVDPTAGGPTLYERLEALFSWSLDQSGTPSLWGLSLGVPGAVELQSVSPLAIPTLGASPAWDGSRLLERLLQRFKMPLWVRSAVQMETIGELEALSPQQRREMLFVDLGTEISAGVITEGRLHRGAHGIAGQIGHVFAGETHTKICGCGNVGCLETVAGCRAIAREGFLAAQDGRSRFLADCLGRNGTVTVADIGTAARLGDPFCADLLARCGRLVGTVLATLTNVLNPSVVVIGGELAQTGDICLAAIREGIYRHSQPMLTRDLAIVRSRMGRSSGLVGAAMVALSEIFAPAFLEGWITAGTPLAHGDVAALLAGAEQTLPITSEEGDTAKKRKAVRS